MNILRFAGEVLLLYFLYRLIFDFIIPIYQTSKKVKQQFGEMHSRMQEQMNQQNREYSEASPPVVNSTQPKNKKEEYIDYEEIKDN